MQFLLIRLILICSSIAATSGDKVFIGVDESVNYDSAKSKCNTFQLTGGQLATWDDAGEYAKIVEIRNSMGTDAYVGLNDINAEGKWEFIDGNNCGCDCDQLEQWAAGEPNDFESGEDVAEVTGGGKLNDQNQNENRAYICEVNSAVGKMYVGVATTVNYDTAKAGCNSINLNGQLATWDSENEYEKIVVARNNVGKDAWVGLNDQTHEGQWKFIDGETSYCAQFDGSDCDNIPQWSENEPNDAENEDAAELWGTGKLNDQSQDENRAYVCEFESNYIRTSDINSYIPLESHPNNYYYLFDFASIQDKITVFSILFNVLFVFGSICYVIRSMANKSDYSKVKVYAGGDEKI